MVEIIDFFDRKQKQIEQKAPERKKQADKLRLAISHHKDQINLLSQELRELISGGDTPDGVA